MNLLFDLPFDSRLIAFSSLDRYYKVKSPVYFVAVQADIGQLAAHLDHPVFPGAELADVLVRDGEAEYFLTTVDDFQDLPHISFAPLNISYEPKRNCYLDPLSEYEFLKSRGFQFRGQSNADWDLFYAVLGIARYGWRISSLEWDFTEEFWGIFEQRFLLSRILEGNFAADGLLFLGKIGFVETFWPELNSMVMTAHSKDHHPEGDVWLHSLETLRYRKTRDLRLSLGLLLHDCGKPFALEQNGHKFDRHAQIGASIARKFLRKLDMGSQLIQDVCFLVENHMLPPGLTELPLFKFSDILGSELFPLLLELYRCDLSSTFRGPDGYYEACRVYRKWLKDSKNFYKSDPRINSLRKKEIKTFL
jgi:poly(A) polymerase